MDCTGPAEPPTPSAFPTLCRDQDPGDPAFVISCITYAAFASTCRYICILISLIVFEHRGSHPRALLPSHAQQGQAWIHIALDIESLFTLLHSSCLLHIHQRLSRSEWLSPQQDFTVRCYVSGHDKIRPAWSSIPVPADAFPVVHSANPCFSATFTNKGLYLLHSLLQFSSTMLCHLR